MSAFLRLRIQGRFSLKAFELGAFNPSASLPYRFVSALLQHGSDHGIRRRA